MNILFCDYIRMNSLDGQASSIHVSELLSNLSALGHGVLPLKVIGSVDQQPSSHELRPSGWERTKNALRSFPMYKPLKGEVHILWSFVCECAIFASGLVLLLRNKGHFDVIYRRHSLFNSEYLLARLFGIPSVREVNGIIAEESRMTGSEDRLSLRAIGSIEKVNMRMADRFIVVTPKLKEVLRREYGIPASKISVIENGANTRLFKPMDTREARECLNLNQTSSYICFVGSLAPWHGVEYLIRAMPRILEVCPDASLLLVGTGQKRAELIHLAQQIDVSSEVIFTGAVPHENVPLYINASDICVAPLIRERNERIGVSPLKLCEYSACKRPVVASRLPGLEFLEQYNAGILVEPENARNLADAIVRLIQNPPLAARMGENGRKYVVQNRGWEAVARRVAGVCEETIEERKGKKNGWGKRR